MDFINKVELTGIKTVDLLDFKPTTPVVALDIADFLHLGLMLKEKEFKEAVERFHWSTFTDQAVAVFCSTEAIVPTWAFMSIAVKLLEVHAQFDYCTVEALELSQWKREVERADFAGLEGEKVVVRAHQAIDPSLYMLVSARLNGIVKTLMFGEAGLPKVISKN